MEEFIMREKNFYEGSAGFFVVALIKKKNNEKINIKKLFHL